MQSVLLIIVVGVLAFGADLTGRWTVKNERDGRQVTRTLVLKVNGHHLAGEIIFPGLGPAPIEAGTLDGDRLQFVVVRKREGTEVRRTWHGVVKGDEIHLTVEGDDGLQMVARKETAETK